MLVVVMAALALANFPARLEVPLFAVLAVIAVLAVTTGVREVTTAVNAMPEPDAARAPQAVAKEFLGKTFGALADSHFRMFYLGNVLQFGCMNMQLVVRGWLVFHLTGSFAALGTMALANALPSVLASPIGGVVADRATKKTVIQIGQIYNAVNAALLAILAAGCSGCTSSFGTSS